MADFEAWFSGNSVFFEERGQRRMTYVMCSKDYAIKSAKEDAMRMDADEFSLYYRQSMKSVGQWERKGSRWYKV